MTKVKKTKKPKARKTKGPIKSRKISKTEIRKIDARLRTTPQPKVESIDKRIKKPLVIVNEPRSQLPQNQIPLRMYGGQDTGAIFNKQLDVLSSREQQLEGKFLDLKNELEKEKKEKKDLEDFSQIQDLGQRIENYKNNVGNEDIVEINQEIKQLLKDRTLNHTNHDLLIDMRLYAKESIKKDIETNFKEVKSTNTLLDDVIHENNLVDEAQVIIDEIKNKEVKAPVNLPSFEAIELLNEMKSTNVKGPIILPTLEEAQTIIKKPRGRPKKEKIIDELVEVKSTNTLLDDKIIDNILDDVGIIDEEYNPNASLQRRQKLVDQARLEREQAEQAFSEKMRLNSLRISEEVRQAKEQRGMMEEDQPYQDAMWRIIGTTKKRSDLLP